MPPVDKLQQTANCIYSQSHLKQMEARHDPVRAARHPWVPPRRPPALPTADKPVPLAFNGQVAVLCELQWTLARATTVHFVESFIVLSGGGMVAGDRLTGLRWAPKLGPSPVARAVSPFWPAWVSTLGVVRCLASVLACGIASGRLCERSLRT